MESPRSSALSATGSSEILMIRRALRLLAGAILVAGTYWNVWLFTRSATKLPPRVSNGTVLLENRFQGIRDRLAELGYRSGRIALITATDLRSEPRTGREDVMAYQAQYAVAPLIVVRDAAETPFVIGDFVDEPSLPEIPAFLIKIYDSGKGVILFRRGPQ